MRNFTQPRPTKDDALKQLGVFSKNARNRISAHTEIVSCVVGRELATRRCHNPSVLVGVRGAVIATDGHGRETVLAAPFVIDRWAIDTQGLATFTVTALEQTVVLVLDQSARDLVAAGMPRLRRLSKETATRFESVETAPRVAVAPTDPAHQPGPARATSAH